MTDNDNKFQSILKQLKNLKLKPHFIIIIALVAGLIVFFGIKSMQQTDKSKTANIELQKEAYINREAGFSFNPPKGWIETDVTGTKVFFNNPEPDEQDGNKLAASLNVTSEEIDTTLNDYVNTAKSQLALALTNYKSLGEEKVTLQDGTKAIAIEGTFKQGSYDIHNRQLVVIKDGKAYVLTASSLSNKWNDYKELFVRSQATFKVL